LVSKTPIQFQKGIDNFGVLLKGKSIELLPVYTNQFDECFMVNNFDKEIDLLGDAFFRKRSVHFVNRLMTAPLKEENYQRFNIKEIQLPKVCATDDRNLKKSIRHYNSFGLKTFFLPEHLLQYNKDFSQFGDEYAKKYPNTGVLAVIYALEIIHPKNLWILGLDFYQSDYLVRRPHQNPIELQRAKMDRINLVEVMAKVFKRYPDININMVTYFNGFSF